MTSPSPTPTHQPLPLTGWMTYDPVSDILTIDGIKFAREFFKHFAASPLEISFRIINRTRDGAITIGMDRDPLAAAAPDMLAALKLAIGHIEHMAAFFGGKGTGYSFEGLGEDMPGIRAALARAEPAA